MLFHFICGEENCTKTWNRLQVPCPILSENSFFTFYFFLYVLQEVRQNIMDNIMKVCKLHFSVQCFAANFV